MEGGGGGSTPPLADVSTKNPIFFLRTPLYRITVQKLDMEFMWGDVSYYYLPNTI